MAAYSLTFYAGRDNAEDFVLLADDAAVDAANINRIVIELLAGDVDSDATPAAFDWPVAMNYTDSSHVAHAAQGVRFNLGAVLAGGTYSGRLVIYDSDHPNGLVWAALNIKVLA